MVLADLDAEEIMAVAASLSSPEPMPSAAAVLTDEGEGSLPADGAVTPPPLAGGTIRTTLLVGIIT